MKYSIGEFASILGVTADTLRLYEKHEIVRPLKDRNNNYRFFGDLDARDLLMSRWYRSMQIPLNEVKELMNATCPERVMDKIAEAQAQLEEEIRRKTLLLDKIADIGAELRGLGETLNTCRLTRTAGMYRLRQTQKNRLLQKDALKTVAPVWMELLPYVFYSFRMNRGPREAAGHENDYSWGLTLLEEDVAKLGIVIGDGDDVEYIPPADCVSSVILSSEESDIDERDFEYMFKYAEEQGLTTGSEIRGKILMSERSGACKKTYLNIYIPYTIP